jgi:hypothetical protein
MSISTVVGIISISPVRQIITKRYRKPLWFQTLLVGDETAAGFKIDIWIPLTTTPASRLFKETVESLRVQDVILIENLALGVWDGKVNGATLRRDRTKIKLVYRINRFGTRERRLWGSVSLEGDGENPGVEKVRRVVEWAQDFVDPGRTRANKRQRSEENYEDGETQLPDDTQ